MWKKKGDKGRGVEKMWKRVSQWVKLKINIQLEFICETKNWLDKKHGNWKNNEFATTYQIIYLNSKKKDTV